MKEKVGKNKQPSHKIGIIGDALAPHFNSAPANQMRLLSQVLKAPVLTCNDLELLPFKKMGRYLVINTRFLRGERRNRFLSLINGACFFPFIKLFERKFDVIYLPGGIDSGFLPVLDLRKCILVINTLPFGHDDEIARAFALEFAPKLLAIIAHSRRVQERLISLGTAPEKIHFAYPWVDSDKFKYSQPPDSDEFRILVASAPDMERSREDPFAEKGISLLLECLAEFSQHHKASLCLLWRGKYNEILSRKIEELNLESRVEIIDQVVDTPPLFAQAHITVIPFRSLRGSPEFPLSAVESIACGRPVVTTDVPEIAEIVREYQCGCVAKAVKEDFLSALIECKQNYPVYQANCRKVADELFSLNLEMLSGLYG